MPRVEPYSHPPDAPSCLCKLVLDCTRVQRQVHGRHQGLARPLLHLLQVPPLRVLIHAQNVQRDDALQLDRHARVERPPEVLLSPRRVRAAAERPVRRNRRLGDFFVVFDGLEGRLRKVLCVFPPEQFGLMVLVLRILGAGDEREDGGYRQGDGRCRLEALVKDIDLVLQARHGLVHCDAVLRRQDGEEGVYEDIVGV